MPDTQVSLTARSRSDIRWRVRIAPPKPDKRNGVEALSRTCHLIGRHVAADRRLGHLAAPFRDRIVLDIADDIEARATLQKPRRWEDMAGKSGMPGRGIRERPLPWACFLVLDLLGEL